MPETGVSHFGPENTLPANLNPVSQLLLFLAPPNQALTKA